MNVDSHLLRRTSVRSFRRSACILIGLVATFCPAWYAHGDHAGCDPDWDVGTASCGRPARGKRAECNNGGSDVTLDKCYIHSFEIDGTERRVVVYYTTTDNACTNVKVCEGGSNDGALCFSPASCPDGFCAAIACDSAIDCSTCSGGPNSGLPCSSLADCGGANCNAPGSSACALGGNAVDRRDDNSNGVPDAIDNLGRWGEEIWRTFVTDYGFADPNRRVVDDVKELEVLLFAGNRGWCCEAADELHGGGIHLVVTDTAPGRERVMEDVMIHEMFHVTQTHYAWGLAEAGAQAMMDHTDADIDTWPMGSYLSLVNSFLGAPQESLLTWHYRHALWFTYFMEQFGTTTDEPQLGVDALVEFYDRVNHNPIETFDAVIRDASGGASTLASAWHDFGVANYVKNLDDPLPAKYRYFDESQPPGEYDWTTLSGSPPVKPDEDLNLDFGVGILALDTLEPWSNHYYRVRPGSRPIITVDYQQDTNFTLGYSLLFIRGNQLVGQESETGRNFVRSIANDSYDEAVLVVSAFADATNVRYAINPPDAELNIVDPIRGRPARVGDPSSPRTFLLKVEVLSGGVGASPVEGIDASDFTVRVGTQTASLLHPESWSFIQGQYWLLMQAPTQFSEDTYDVSVTWATLSETQFDAADYQAIADIDHLLVIDRSGSMGDFNKMEAAKSAARLYIDGAVTGDKIGTVSFRDFVDPALDMHLTDWTTGSRDTAFEKINALTALGGTAIGNALTVGLSLEFDVRGGPDHAWEMIVLSDGRENGTPDIDDFLATYKTRADAGFKNPVVHAIAIGPDANRPELQRLTTETGGLFLFAAEPSATRAGGPRGGLLDVDLPNDLAERYRVIAEAVTGEQQIFSERGTWNACNQEIQHFILVEQGATSAVFTLHWNRDFVGGGTPSAVLFHPNGAIGFPDLVDDTHAVFRESSPMSGNWRLAFIVEGFEFCGGSYIVEAAVTSELELKLFFPARLEDRSVGLGQPILVALNSSAPVLDAKINVTIIIPEYRGALDILPRTLATLELLDDGLHNDGRADDGFYGNVFRPVLRRGAFTVIADATGTTALTGAFRRRAMGSFDVSPGTDSDGDGMTDRFEEMYGLDPFSNDSLLDRDADTLTNLDEFNRGSNPNSSDTDGGGEHDGSEVASGRDPLEPRDDRTGPIRAFYVQRIDGHDTDDPNPDEHPHVGVHLAFEAGPGHTRMILLRSTQEYGSYIVLNNNIPAPARAYVDENVNIGTTYYYILLGMTPGFYQSAFSGPIQAVAKLDNIAPDGSVLINDGAMITDSRDVQLRLLASPDAEEMLLGNTTLADATWDTFKPTKAWRLAENVGPNGVATVVVRFRDGEGNESSNLVASIRLLSAVGDCNADGVVDLPNDFAQYFSCMEGPEQGPLSAECLCADCDDDNDVDLADYRCLLFNFGGERCGNNVCDLDEDCESCRADCGDCGPVCGDNVCEQPEDCVSCPLDCGNCGPICGDNVCEKPEDCASCPEDCGQCGPVCGDNVCEQLEDCVSCPADCGSCSGSCCVANQTIGCQDAPVMSCVCASDSSCCTQSWHEGCVDLAVEECDGCGPVCGNGKCEFPETANTCPTDCSGPLCPDLIPSVFTGPQQLARGQELGGVVTAEAANIGTANAGGFFVGYYLSTDAVITTSDTLLIGGRDSISSLQYGSSAPVPTGMTVPANYPLGAAYLGMFVDEFNQVPGECKESNNTIAIPVEVVPSP